MVVGGTGNYNRDWSDLRIFYNYLESGSDGGEGCGVWPGGGRETHLQTRDVHRAGVFTDQNQGRGHRTLEMSVLQRDSALIKNQLGHPKTKRVFGTLIAGSFKHKN